MRRNRRTYARCCGYTCAPGKGTGRASLYTYGAKNSSTRSASGPYRLAYRDHLARRAGRCRAYGRGESGGYARAFGFRARGARAARGWSTRLASCYNCTRGSSGPGRCFRRANSPCS